MAGYIPAEDGKALTWMQKFSGVLSARAEVYGVSDADAENLAMLVDRYAESYPLAIDELTRGPVTVAKKDEARAFAEQACRTFAILIKANAGISDPDKIAIGVRPVNPGRTPVDAPTTYPMLMVVGGTPLAQTVRYADSATPGSGRKPFGAIQLQLFVTLAEAVAADPTDARLQGTHTRNPVGVGFDKADDGKVATYFARWITRRGDAGPFGPGASMRVAA